MSAANTRLFSILRRKVGLIDLITPIRPTADLVVSYRLKTDVDPGGLFATTAITVPRTGFIDPAVASGQYNIVPGENVRIIFKPSNFSLPNEAAFWVKLVYVDGAGAEMVSPAPSAATLVLPPSSGSAETGFTATAPNQASLAASLRLDLPRSMQNFRIRNIAAATALFVAYEEGGPEFEVPFGTEVGSFFGSVTSLWVRGGGAVAKFTVSFSPAFPR